MADPYYQPQQQHTGAMKNPHEQTGPSASKILAVVTLFPLGGLLMLLAGITLTGTLIGLFVTTPLFVIFSPLLVPAALTIALAVTGFLTSGAFGITALSSLSWIINYFRQVRGSVPEQLEHAKRRVEYTAGNMGQRVKEAGQRTQEATTRS